MGAVVRAHDLLLDRPVAIKVMHAQLLTMPDAARRFAVEASVIGKLKSPHTVKVLEIDRLPSGAPYIVMELLEGIDLGTMVATRGPLPVERALHYMLHAVEAIVEAHGHGIVHRDLKPQNLFLTKEGIVKVLDFGLAKALRPLDDAPRSTRMRTGRNMILGSPSFMAVEQIWPGCSVDERTDIWALGATLYTLLSGAPPFSGPDMQSLMKCIATQDPPRVSDRRSDVSAIVDAAIAQCMRKNPAERYQSVVAFQRVLLHLRAEVESRVGPAAATTGRLPSERATEMELPAAEVASWPSDDEPTAMNLPNPDSTETPAVGTSAKRQGQ
jgi:serine/threonine-protein kinase